MIATRGAVKMAVSALQPVVLAGAIALLSFDVTAAVTYQYTGNPLDQGDASSHIGRAVTATVTFDDSVVGYTGTVGPSAVQSWAIRIAEVSGSEMGSASGAVSDLWPLYFVFDSGSITAWQVLARPFANGTPEIYTTRDSPFSSINPTADYFAPGDRTSAYNLDTPGVWAIPEPSSYALTLGGLALLALGLRRRSA